MWALLVLGAVSLYPFESTTLSSQAVLVVTDDSRPVQGVAVRQSWQNYSLESDGHEQDLTTDESGRITFPRRTLRASVFRRIAHPIWNVLRQGVHASFGVHTDIIPLGDMSVNPVGNRFVEARAGDIVFRRR